DVGAQKMIGPSKEDLCFMFQLQIRPELREGKIEAATVGGFAIDVAYTIVRDDLPIGDTGASSGRVSLLCLADRIARVDVEAVVGKINPESAGKFRPFLTGEHIGRCSRNGFTDPKTPELCGINLILACILDGLCGRAVEDTDQSEPNCRKHDQKV